MYFTSRDPTVPNNAKWCQIVPAQGQSPGKVPVVCPRYFWEPGTVSHHALASLVMPKISVVVPGSNLPDVSRSVSRSTVLMSGLGIYGPEIQRNAITYLYPTLW